MPHPSMTSRSYRRILDEHGPDPDWSSSDKGTSNAEGNSGHDHHVGEPRDEQTMGMDNIEDDNSEHEHMEDHHQESS